MKTQFHDWVFQSSGCDLIYKEGQITHTKLGGNFLNIFKTFESILQYSNYRKFKNISFWADWFEFLKTLQIRQTVSFIYTLTEKNIS